MDATWRKVLWEQLGASIDMLENAIKACPDQLWSDRARQPQVWYLAYHPQFFLDLCCSCDALVNANPNRKRESPAARRRLLHQLRHPLRRPSPDSSRSFSPVRVASAGCTEFV